MDCPRAWCGPGLVAGTVTIVVVVTLAVIVVVLAVVAVVAIIAGTVAVMVVFIVVLVHKEGDALALILKFLAAVGIFEDLPPAVFTLVFVVTIVTVIVVVVVTQMLGRRGRQGRAEGCDRRDGDDGWSELAFEKFLEHRFPLLDWTPLS